MIGQIKLVVLFIVGVAHFSTAMICPGCPIEINKNDPEIQNKLTTTLSNYKSAPKGTENERTSLIELTKVTSQVVNGVKYTYNFKAKGLKTSKPYECTLVVYSRPWLQENTVNEYNCQEITNRNKRSLLGGKVEVDLDESSLSELRQFVAQELTKKQESKYTLAVVKVLSATQQVVSGLMTRLTVKVAQTECLVDSSETKDCPLQKEGHKVCKVAVWEKPWLKMKELVNSECSDVPQFCPGCPSEISPTDDYSSQCLKRTLFNLNFKSHSNKHWKLKKINKVQKQVVAGLKYTYDFELEDANKKSHSCNAVVILQPWISAEPIVENFKCSPNIN